jgi:hypothetical protein
LQRSKENLERNTFSLLDEIKGLKLKIDTEALSINTVSGDLKNKTRRLEDESRHQVICLKFLIISYNPMNVLSINLKKSKKYAFPLLYANERICNRQTCLKNEFLFFLIQAIEMIG